MQYDILKDKFTDSERKTIKLPYKFLLFDLDHTLLDFDTAEDIALTQFLKEQGVT